MSRQGAATAWAGVALLVGSGLVTCRCTEPGPGADAGVDASSQSDAGPDAAIDAEPPADATPRPDAAPIWDAGPEVDAVPGSLLQLPPTGLNEMRGVDHEHPYVAYSEWRDADYDVFLYDLSTRTESPVCTEAGRQGGPKIINGWVLWSDDRYYSEPDNTAVEIFGHEIASATTVQLTSDGFVKTLLGASATHLLYYTDEGMPSGHGAATLVLQSRQSGEKRVLCEYIYGPQGASLSDTHVAWAALDPTNGWVNRSVFLHDIAGDDTQLLSSTTPGDVRTTDISADWLVWDDNRYGNYDVFAYAISAGQEVRVTDEPHDQNLPRVGGPLVVFMDFRYTGGSFHDSTAINDLVVYDLETGDWRKVTGWSARWGSFGAPQQGWQVMIRSTFQGASTYEVWAKDLVANQVVDATGHVVPAP